MKPLLTAATLAVAMGFSAPMALAEDTTNTRDAYEARMNQMMEEHQASMKDTELNEETQNAWDAVEESWDDLTQAADENWEAAKTTFQENWEEFEQEWDELTADNS
ncbi:MAG: hypothetical protein RLW87_07510 [Alphaproteobacteria bacterium]|jgi:predicted nucleotide-binding protein (sugar kinase/HSP70/actin superfamily)|nr:hypothetical protein [Alphaproteobacteria bacterium]MEC9266315.1 hypothetical protein [Pseudomonadota bacterium]